MHTTPTVPAYTRHVGPTAEELTKRARIRELRGDIALLATFRKAMNRAYRLPHGSDAFTEAGRAAARIVKLEWKLGRHCKRGQITALHVELAALRGKVHLAPSREDVTSAHVGTEPAC